MPSTYEKIDKTTTSGSQASVTFSSIPATYTDLRLVINGGGSNYGGIRVRLNGDTASNYSGTYILGDGSSASSGRDTSLTYGSVGYPLTTTLASLHTVDFLNYANTTTFKTWLVRSSDAASISLAQVQLWRKTPEAINSMLIYPATGNWLNNTTLSLYGIKGA